MELRLVHRAMRTAVSVAVSTESPVVGVIIVCRVTTASPELGACVRTP